MPPAKESGARPSPSFGRQEERDVVGQEAVPSGEFFSKDHADFGVIPDSTPEILAVIYVPEPSSILLVFLGLLRLAWRACR